MVRKSDYENYDYREFWQDDKRLYEDNSERLALRRLLNKIEVKDRTFTDLGCGYGRLFNEYMDFKNIILVDYSLNNLKNARGMISRFLDHDKHKLENIFFVAADVNNLPFKEGIIDVALSVRVIHHISDPGKFIREVRRILSDDSIFLLEFANKRNLKNILRFFTGRIKRSPFNSEVFHVGDTILNYHPGHIQSLLVKNGFKALKKISVSNFRLGFLKKHVRMKILIFLEKSYQNLFSWTGTGPSIFIKAVACSAGNKKVTDTIGTGIFKKKDIAPITPEVLFSCPSCRAGDISQNKYSFVCGSCYREFRIIDGIYDFKL